MAVTTAAEFPPPSLQRTLSRLGDEFLVEFYDAEVRRYPSNIEALSELGQVLTRLAHYERGLEVDRQLVRLVPDNPTVHYNLACSLARLGRLDESLDALEGSVELGYADGEYMQADDDLANLRDEERFRSLLRRIETAATT